MTSIDPSLSIAQILERWPSVVEVLVRRRLGCVGCAMAPFDTLADMATIYEIDLDTLRAEVEADAARPFAAFGGGDADEGGAGVDGIDSGGS